MKYSLSNPCLAALVASITTAALMPALAQSLTTFVTNDFSGSGNCSMCHSGLRDSANNDVSVDTHWRPSMMANSGKDPLWQAKISTEVLRTPALASVIEEKCSRCHTPMARRQAIADGTPVAILNNGFLNPANTLHAAAMDGVSCTLCHQIRSTGLGQPETFTGQYVIDTSTTSPSRPMYGVFANPSTQQMRMRVGYTPTQGTHIGTSELCGSCHTLYTPIVDDGGNVVGEFPEQMTYLEWKHSDYGDGAGTDQSCQDCHMPPAVGGVKISTMPMMLSTRQPFPIHDFTGANLFMLNILKNNATAIGATATTANFNDALARTNSNLQTQTASLSIADTKLTTDSLTLKLDIKNKVGHKLPSGIPARRMWVHLTVKDGAGATVFESGRPQADGSIAGNEADLNPDAYEPHYDLISSPDQVQIYEPIIRDVNGHITYTLLRTATYVKDNRLLPSGFDKTTAGPDVAAYGDAATDSNFTGGSDQITYVIGTKGRPGPFSITARLLYQTASYAFVRDLRQDNTSHVQTFGNYYDQADKTPTLLASATRQQADLNGDSYVDNADLELLAACSTGPAIPYDPQALPAACTLTPDDQHIIAADFDRDGDVDATDFAVLQRGYTR